MAALIAQPAAGPRVRPWTAAARTRAPDIPTSPGAVRRGQEQGFRRPLRLLTVPAVAGQLAVSEKTIRRWIERGELPMHRLGRSVRIAEDDLTAFLGGRRR